MPRSEWQRDRGPRLLDRRPQFPKCQGGTRQSARKAPWLTVTMIRGRPRPSHMASVIRTRHPRLGLKCADSSAFVKNFGPRERVRGRVRHPQRLSLPQLNGDVGRGCGDASRALLFCLAIRAKAASQPLIRPTLEIGQERRDLGVPVPEIFRDPDRL